MPVAVDAGRVQAMLDELHRIGLRPSGGVFRGVYDPSWRRARDLIAGWMGAAGLAARVDAVGNVWGHLAGREPGPPVASGSHFDSVPDGGKYDGPLGVVGAIVAIEALRRGLGEPRRPLAALATCEEEGSRFPAGFWASRAILGRIGPDEPERLRDAEGVSMAEAMRAAGYDPARIGQAKAELAAFVELHVEQGPVLEGVAAGAAEQPDGSPEQTHGTSRGARPIGVVAAITGLARAHVTLTGRPDHAGTTPMLGRRDALLGLAEVAPAVRDLALGAGPPAVITIGRIEVTPNVANVVPGTVRFTLDVRHPDEPTLRRLVEAAVACCRDAAGRHGLGCQAEVSRLSPPVRCAPELVETVRAAVEALGHRPFEIVSGAGHDAQALAAAFPTAMLFVVSRDGRSHCPEEHTTPADCAAGVSALAETLRRLAY